MTLLRILGIAILIVSLDQGNGCQRAISVNGTSPRTSDTPAPFNGVGLLIPHATIPSSVRSEPIKAMYVQLPAFRYNAVDLGVLPAGRASEAKAINSLGEVVGSSLNAQFRRNAVRWMPATPPQDLGTLGGSESHALGLNSFGQIVGSADALSEPNHAFRWIPTILAQPVMSDLTNIPQPNGTILTANAISDNGVALGQAVFNLIDVSATDGYGYNFPYKAFHELGAYGSGQTEFFGISGHAAAGVRIDANGVSHAAFANVDIPSSAQDLPSVANQHSSVATSIAVSEAGDTVYVVGSYTLSSAPTSKHPVLWTINNQGITTTDLGLLATVTSAEATGVNAYGHVVGGMRGRPLSSFIWDQKHGLQSLNSLLVPNSRCTIYDVTGINDSEQIVGSALWIGAIDLHALLLTPHLNVQGAELLNAANVSVGGGTSYQFTIRYSDNVPIDASSLGNKNITVMGPHGFNEYATLVSPGGANATPLIGSYTIVPPSGAWDYIANGTYLVVLEPNQVRNSAGAFIGGGSQDVLGFFVVNIPLPRGSISGMVYLDSNSNGQHDTTEPGLGPLSVYLDTNDNGKADPGEPTINVGPSGKFAFTGLLPGVYHISQSQLAGYRQTQPPSGKYAIALGPNQDLSGIDFGNAAKIGILSFTPTEGTPPQFLKPGTKVTITGQGFTGDTQVTFGNTEAVCTPKIISDSVLQVEVPRVGTTGPIAVRDSQGGPTAISSTPFVVHDYRSTNAFVFENDGVGYGEYDFWDMLDVYGASQVMVTVDPCEAVSFGLFNCPIPTGLPDPLALFELGVINAGIRPKDGQCVGFSLASARMSRSKGLLNGLPMRSGTPGNNVWDLANTTNNGGPTSDLRQIIHLAHLEQTSAEFVKNYVEQTVGNSINGFDGFLYQLKSYLANGQPVLLPFQSGSISHGHCVLAYDVEELPGKVLIHVYDPNNPFTVGEIPVVTGQLLPDGTAHQQSLSVSRFDFLPDGSWSFQGSGNKSVGDLSEIALTPLSIFDHHTLIASVSGISELITFGAAKTSQVSDSSGRTLLAANGLLNKNNATRLPKAARYLSGRSGVPIDIIDGTGRYTQRIVGTAGGRYTAAVITQTMLGRVINTSTRSDETDELTMDSTSNTLIFSTSALSKAVNCDLAIGAPGSVMREVTWSGSSSKDGTESLRFENDRNKVSLTHGGPSQGSVFTFSQIGEGMSVQTLCTGRFDVRTGDSLTLTPSDWNHLQRAKVTINIQHANGTTQSLSLANAGTAHDVDAHEATAFKARVATFPTVPGELSATIEWGDGTTSEGSIARNVDGTIGVFGEHLYSKQGYFSTSVSLLDGAGPIASVRGRVRVLDTKFTLEGTPISPVLGVQWKGRLGVLHDSPSGDSPRDFDVAIDWGDGSNSKGWLQRVDTGTFDVVASHVFSLPDNKGVTIVVTERITATAIAHRIKAVAEFSVKGAIAELQLPIPGSEAADYVTRIDWGDGVTTEGILKPATGETYNVSGDHVYIRAGLYAPRILLTGGPRVSKTITVRVLNKPR